MITDDELQKLHQTLDEILDYAVSVCEQHGLTYVLLYGTALGAYRHHGIIPWDDDLDIGMPRDDYEKFLRILSETPDPRYTLQTGENEPNYFFSFAKIRKNGTIFVENCVGPRYKHNGVFIDVFPIDGVRAPRSFAQRLRTARIRYLLHSLRFDVSRSLYRSRGRVRYLADVLLCAPARLIPTRRRLQRVQRLMQHDGANEPYAAQFEDVSAAEIVPREVYFPPREIEFNGKMRCVPRQIETYLALAYGDDYMQLPPEAQRRTHEPQELKL